MGQKVSNFVKDAGRAVAKGAISFVGGKIPFVGPILANKINEQFANGGKVIAMADGGIAGPKMAINTPAQLISLIKKAPELAEKHGLSVSDVQQAVASAKEGQLVPAKKRGGLMKKKKMGGDMAMVHSGGGGEGVGSFARGGKVLSVF
tara:strand:+ start:174 stop:617 length:444 start_codon:yes stop_codon:yes gene_type:complete